MSNVMTCLLTGCLQPGAVLGNNGTLGTRWVEKLFGVASKSSQVNYMTTSIEYGACECCDKHIIVSGTWGDGGG